MSKVCTMAIVAALLVVPGSAAVCWAEEANTDAQQSCNKDGCCNDGCDKEACCKQGEQGCSKEACKSNCAECTRCKCENCDNAACDKDNCTCDASKTCDADRAGEGCSSCDQTAAADGDDGRLGITLAAAPCSKGNCESGKCCKTSCGERLCFRESKGCNDCSNCNAGKCCSEGSCSENRVAWCSEGSALRLGTDWMIEGTLPSPMAYDTMATWGWAVRDLSAHVQSEPSPESRQRIRVKLASTEEENRDAVSAAYEQPLVASDPTGRRIIKQLPQSSRPPKAFQYSIQIVEDHGQCFSEYEGLREGRRMTCAESKTLLPTMRTLAKHQLIKQVSSPKLICAEGQKAELEVCGGGSEEPQRLNLAVTSETAQDDQLMVELTVCCGEERNFEVCTALLVEPGQSIVLNANRKEESSSDEGGEGPAMFIIVTPEVVE